MQSIRINYDGNIISNQTSETPNFIRLPTQGLNDYISQNKKPTYPLYKTIMRPPSGDTRKRSKQTVEERKEIIKNIQGIEVQIKNLVDKVVNEDKIKRNNLLFNSSSHWNEYSRDFEP